jgi:transposase
MMGYKLRRFKVHREVSLEFLVPDDNFYRQVQEAIDFSFVRDFVQHLYSAFGRPSIDPVVFFKLQLIAFFEGIRSERQLMEQVHLNIAHRWFIGYDLHEAVPDHSSLTRIRERYGLEIFHQFFEHIVNLCVEAGLVWGEELYFDGTKVLANADIGKMIEKTEYEAQQHVEELWNIPKFEPEVPSMTNLVDKYNGEQITGNRKPSYQRIADEKVSPIDPDASPMRPSGGGSAVLGYHDHYVVDGGKARIILSALVTPASIMDNTPLLDLVDWVCNRWELTPKIASGDAKYGTVPNIVGLEKRGLKAYIPLPDLSKRTKYYPASQFEYDPEEDQYTCPQGETLMLYSRRKTEENFVYRADAGKCNACTVKESCTGSKSGRHIFRSFHQEYLDRVATYTETEAYQKAMRKRGVWVEPLFGEAKDFHRLRRFRLRGLQKTNIEGVMIAAGQNLKRLVKHSQEKLFTFFDTWFQRFFPPRSWSFSTGWYDVRGNGERENCGARK